MKNFAAIGALAVSAALSFAPQTFAAAKTYVSQTGSDANTSANCSRGSPCRNFAAAYTVTNAGGEIVALDSTGYGALTITKAISVTAPAGIVATVQVGGGTGFTVAAGANDVVTLRGLTFSASALNSGTGVAHSTGKLTILDSTFTGLNFGLTTTGKVTIVNTNFIGNLEGVKATGNGGGEANPPNGPTQVRIVSGNVLNNGTGFHMTDAGAKGGTCNGANIFFHSTNGGDSFPNVIGNATFAVADVRSPGELEQGVVNIGTYNPGPGGLP